MKWDTTLFPHDPRCREVRFHRTCAALVTLELDGQRFDLRTTPSGDIPGGGKWKRSGWLAITFDWQKRKTPVGAVLEYHGEPLCLVPTVTPAGTKAPPSAPFRIRATAETVGDPGRTDDVTRLFANRRARILTRVSGDVPLACEELAMCIFDERTDYRMPGAHKYLDPSKGPHRELVDRVVRRGRHLAVPPPNKPLLEMVAALAPVVATALRDAMCAAFGLAAFTINDPKHRNLLARVFCRFANGDLADPAEAPTDGVPDSGYFFCFPEFALLARNLNSSELPGDGKFFAECFRVFVRATRVYYGAYSHPRGMKWIEYGPKRFWRAWETVEADLSREFADHSTWTNSQWDAKYTQILEGCCLGSSRGQDPTAARIRELCGNEVPISHDQSKPAPPPLEGEAF